MRRLPPACVPLLALLALLLAASPASAANFQKSRHLWATVNVCDTAKRPDTIGIRASMPGLRRKGETMWMRFRVQYYSRAKKRWHNFSSRTGTDSGYVRLGHANIKARQAGWLFPFSPQKGERFRLRGAVEFQWRKRRRVMRNARELTTRGHHVRVADPKGYSAATCLIVG